MRVLVAQINPAELDTAANLRRLEQLLPVAAAERADLLVLPETWTTGYDLEHARELAAESEALLPSISELARRHGVAVVGSMIVPDPGGTARNEAILVAADGSIAARYAKSHLIGAFGEKATFVPGRLLVTHQLGGAHLGLAICYDLRFPELFRTLALAGADLFVIPAEWPAQRVEHWELLLRARAIENQAWVIGCARVGSDRTTTYSGRSAVVDPWGTVVAVAPPDAEASLVVDIDPAKAHELRRSFPVLADSWLRTEA